MIFRNYCISIWHCFFWLHTYMKITYLLIVLLYRFLKEKKWRNIIKIYLPPIPTTYWVDFSPQNNLKSILSSIGMFPHYYRQGSLLIITAEREVFGQMCLSCCWKEAAFKDPREEKRKQDTICFFLLIYLFENFSFESFWQVQFRMILKSSDKIETTSPVWMANK